ncbi:HAD-like domain-containing protein [Ilyonectria robusta]|uniref:HAD-like domain-containing protein n=1 Tax=Ilyonectria robusta TaxID=1079257 RepID=UPI001E8D6260|nr:HAD-like domain-containing protein [Ilyonectria robusta]KAH8729449.1 HAD-like domain-containing protein [Ilyonectria robusta]
MELTLTDVVFFDLDGTFFDHCHLLRIAISAIQRKYTGLAGGNVEELINQYKIALQQAYDNYLDKIITYEEVDIQKIRLFFAALGLYEPSPEEVKKFRARYKAVYRENRRAAPGSIETLARLREHGYRIDMITNGQMEDQSPKTTAIEPHHHPQGNWVSKETVDFLAENMGQILAGVAEKRYIAATSH